MPKHPRGKRGGRSNPGKGSKSSMEKRCGLPAHPLPQAIDHSGTLGPDMGWLDHEAPGVDFLSLPPTTRDHGQ
ncbi:MAG: hypothetical protein WC080_00485 [Patescibacteria group bacterium]